MVGVSWYGMVVYVVFKVVVMMFICCFGLELVLLGICCNIVVLGFMLILM